MLKKIVLGLFVISIIIFVTAMSIELFHPPTLEKPANELISNAYPARFAPPDRVKENQIHVYEDKIVIELQNARWARFADTDSMIPFLDEGSNALQIEPKSPDEIEIGDIISYEYEDIVIIHRVIEIGKDNKGVYYIAKGDNNQSPDPLRIRFNQIRRVLVGIIY